MIKHKYGTITEEQLKGYKERLHNRIHWLLIYKDPKCDVEDDDKSFDFQFQDIMREIESLNSLLYYPVEIVELLILLESARQETLDENYNFWVFRKYILDSHGLIDKLMSDFVSKEGVKE